MIHFTGIDTKQQNIHTPSKKYKSAQKPKMAPTTYNPIKNQKIGVAEGAELFLGGVIKQGKEMITSIIQHPLRAATIMAGTTIGIMALPLIGIPSAVGGGVLAIGFAGLAITKGINHAILFSKSNKEGSYDLARLHLQQLGEDTFDVALSAPFVPKAINSIKNFTKYGKVGINNSLLAELKETKGGLNKLKTLIKTDKELSRSINFQSAVDKEISLLTELTDAQKAQIKQELLEFNIAVEKIPELVLQKYAQAKGITVQPNLKYATMAPNTYGMAVADNCTIYLNNHKPYKGPATFAEFETIAQELKGNEYFITYKNKNTGAVIVETIEAQILDKYNQLCKTFKMLSPESTKILTLLHERHHIYQFAQAFKMKGFDWARGLNQEGKRRFEQMVAEMPKIKLGSPEAMIIETYTQGLPNGTPLAYIKRPLEIGARELEIQALTHPAFAPLNQVFKTMKYSKGLSIGENILITDARIESSKV